MLIEFLNSLLYKFYILNSKKSKNLCNYIIKYQKSKIYKKPLKFHIKYIIKFYNKYETKTNKIDVNSFFENSFKNKC